MESKNIDKTYVTTKEAAEILGISTATLYRMLEKGVLEPSKTPGGQRRFDVSELEAYKESSRTISAVQNPSGKTKETAIKVVEKAKLALASTEQEEVKIPKPVDKRNTLK